MTIRNNKHGIKIITTGVPILDSAFGGGTARNEFQVISFDWLKDLNYIKNSIMTNCLSQFKEESEVLLVDIFNNTHTIVTINGTTPGTVVINDSAYVIDGQVNLKALANGHHYSLVIVAGLQYNALPIELVEVSNAHPVVFLMKSSSIPAEIIAKADCSIQVVKGSTRRGTFISKLSCVNRKDTMNSYGCF